MRGKWKEGSWVDWLCLFFKRLLMAIVCPSQDCCSVQYWKKLQSDYYWLIFFLTYLSDAKINHSKKAFNYNPLIYQTIFSA
jgi:hypothetical protein